MNIYYTAHALQRIHERSIDRLHVVKAVKEGALILDYPDDKPYPSQLVLLIVDHKPLHVVYSLPDDNSGIDVIVITVYEPSEHEWNETFTRRRDQL